MEKTPQDKGEDNSNYNDLRRTTLGEEYKERLNPNTKYWRDSLRTSTSTSSYEDRTYKADNERRKPSIANEIKNEVDANKPKKKKTKKAVRWSKKS
jgi:hypothetical protein